MEKIATLDGKQSWKIFHKRDVAPYDLLDRSTVP
jgi:hypothetical protein